MTTNITSLLEAVLKDAQTIADEIVDEFRKATAPETAEEGCCETPEEFPVATDSEISLAPADLAREAVRALKKAEAVAGQNNFEVTEFIAIADRYIKLSEIALID